MGTLIYELKNVEEKNEHGAWERKIQKKKVAYLLNRTDEYVVVRGGRPGLGNKANKTIVEHQKGEVGQEKWIEFELRLMADIGFIGLPNAGKSTLLAALTRSLPKIASYPFTTLKPVLGQMKYVDGFEIWVADIPGIVKGSFEKKGLGIEFLRHCTKVQIFVFVLDMSHFAINTPREQLEILREEIRKYDARLLEKPWLILANKCDTIGNYFF
jgi:GTP-binding protein